MKKRINTLSYNTETAQKLGEWSNDLPVTEFGYCHEVLYKKRTGQYFLYGEGGAMSNYRKPVYGSSNAWQGGEDIIPLTREEAQKWFEKASNDDEELASDEVYEREFGQIEKNDEKVDLHVKISQGAFQKLERLTQAQKASKQDIINQLIWSAD